MLSLLITGLCSLVGALGTTGYVEKQVISVAKVAR